MNEDGAKEGHAHGHVRRVPHAEHAAGGVQHVQLLVAGAALEEQLLQLGERAWFGAGQAAQLRAQGVMRAQSPRTCDCRAVSASTRACTGGENWAATAASRACTAAKVATRSVGEPSTPASEWGMAV